MSRPSFSATPAASPTESLERSAQIARALGHPVRLRILALLRRHELCLCQVVAIVGLAPATVSTHVRELRRAGLVEQTKRGRWAFLSLATGPEQRAWLAAAWWQEGDRELASDEGRLEELLEVPLEELCRDGSRRTQEARTATKRSPRSRS